MNHPDVLKAYSINTFLYIFKKDYLEISTRANKWVVKHRGDKIMWVVDKIQDDKTLGIFNSSGSCTSPELENEIFYKQIKHWMDLKEGL